MYNILYLFITPILLNFVFIHSLRKLEYIGDLGASTMRLIAVIPIVNIALIPCFILLCTAGFIVEWLGD
jgi:hypothetical protein